MTTDLVCIPDTAVPPMVLDMEKPFNREEIGLDGKRRLYLAALFSLDYVNIPLVVQNAARVLVTHERFIAIAHHAESPILEDFRYVPNLLEAIEPLLALLTTIDPSVWRSMGSEVETLLNQKLILSPFHSFSVMSERNLYNINRFDDNLSMREGRTARYSRLLVRVRLAIEGKDRMEFVQDAIRLMYRMLKDEYDLTQKLAENTFRRPEDLTVLFSNQFDTVLSSTFYAKENPLAIGAVFKRK
ncbi:hypothetical protein HY988_06080 [Candidatus Micrarchaeota archaeon]|nr:hypothetical protein [Candidatus Micrarchaeota archaeon]